MVDNRHVAGIILGAGIGRRLGLGPKAFLHVDGVPLVERAARLMADAGIKRICAVLPVDYADHWTPNDVMVVVNPDPDSGPVTSLVQGLRALEAKEPLDTLMVFPVDHPKVVLDDVQRVRKASRGALDGISRIVPSWEQRGGHPIMITSIGLNAVRGLARPRGQSLREVLAKAGDARYIPASGPGVLRNWNVPEDRSLDS